MSVIKKIFFDFFSQHSYVANAVYSLPYAMVFKTTHYCWNNCPHCCESAGANMPKNYIPSAIIENYINQAIKDPNFSKDLVFTGGEIMSAYKYHDESNYAKKLLNMGLGNKCSVDIKTDAGWVFTPMRDTIFSDLVDVLSAHSTSSFRLIPMQVSLSLDRFHPHAMQKNIEFITEMSRRQKNSSLVINISSFEQDADMFEIMLATLRERYKNVHEMVLFGSPSTEHMQKNLSNTVWSVNKNIVLKFSAGTLFDGGRAKNIENAYHTPVPQFSFLAPGNPPHVLMAFDSFGNVTLGENSGKKITVPWRDKNGAPRPLNDIRQDLIIQAGKEEARYRFNECNRLVAESIKNDIKNVLNLFRVKKR